MTSQLKICCLLKTTAKKFWTELKEGRKSHVFRTDEEEGHIYMTGRVTLRLKKSTDQQYRLYEYTDPYDKEEQVVFKCPPTYLLI